MHIYRGDSEIINIVVNNNTQLKKSILNEDFIQASFVMDSYFDFQIGDYLNWRGKKYTIFKQPSVKKQQANEFQYNIDFESDQYRFQNAMYLFDGQPEFYLVGNFQKFANLIIVNMNRIMGSDYYQLGETPNTDVKNLNFSNFNCLYVTQFICKEFEKEFYFSDDGKTLNFVDKVGKDTELFFEFRSGLRNIERQKVTDTNLVTRVYAFGSERNITKEYGGVSYTGKRLRLSDSPHYLEHNTDKFGVIEGAVNFDEVYPRRTGTVTAVDSNDIFKFTDASMDFDLNDQLIEGVTAKLTFNTGNLAGYEIEIHKYNHSSKQFDVIQYQDENEFKFPSDDFKIQAGDEYVLHDVKMPQSYIDNAETELQQKAQQYLEENSLPNVIYSIVPDYPYLRKNLIQLNVGDIITVRDDEFGVELQTRIISLTQSLANEYLYSIKVGDKVTVSYLNRIVADTLDNANNIRVERYDRTVQYNHIRRNLKNIDELRDAVFDPDGYFDADKIKPLSIETNMLSVGSKSQNYLIRNLLIEANYQANPDKTKIGDGTLVHFTIGDTVKEWNLTGAVKTHSDTNQFYYIYARCVRNGTTGDFLVSSQQYKVDAGDTYYYFWIGVLHSAQDNVRGISLTYGQTTINGKFITTGRVQSIDGINFLDLDTGQFNVGNETSGLDWNVFEANKLTLRGALVQTSKGTVLPIENVFASIVFKGDFNADTIYYNNSLRRDVVKYTDDNYYIYKGVSGVALAWSTSNWEYFGAQFESVATNLLLAENANIADWIIKDGKITSQNEYNGKPRVQLDGINGKITLVSPKSTYTNTGNVRTYEHTLLIDSENGKFQARHDGDSFQSSGVAYMDSEGVFANFAGIQALPLSSGIEIKGAVVGLGFGKLDKSAYENNSAIVGVFGSSSNSSDNPAPSYGGYFLGLFATGFHLNVKTITTTTYLTYNDVIVHCYQTSPIIVYLEPNPQKGKYVEITNINNVQCTINGNGNELARRGVSLDIDTINHGYTFVLIWNGSHWIYTQRT